MGEWDNDDGWDEAGLAEIDALEQQAVLGEPPASARGVLARLSLQRAALGVTATAWRVHH